MARVGRSRREVKSFLTGVVNIQFTPFESDTELDERALRDNTRFMIEGGLVNGKAVQTIGGSNGEGFSLSDAEYEKLIRIVVDEAAGAVPIVVGCLREGASQVINLARCAEKAGADAIMVLAPYYYPNPSDEVVYQHFKAIADATEIGIMIYNNPTVTGKDMSLECIERLASIDHIVALKETTPNVGKLRQVAAAYGERFALNANTYRSLMPFDYQMGIKGHNHFTANFDPKAALEIDAVDRSGDFQNCQDLWSRYLDLYNYVFTGDMYRATAFGKEMARIAGRPMGSHERLPLQRPGAEQRSRLRELMIKTGLCVE